MKRLIALRAGIGAARPARFGAELPDKPIHIIVPFTPGSATDVVGARAWRRP